MSSNTNDSPNSSNCLFGRSWAIVCLVECWSKTPNALPDPSSSKKLARNAKSSAHRHRSRVRSHSQKMSLSEQCYFGLKKYIHISICTLQGTFEITHQVNMFPYKSFLTLSYQPALAILRTVLRTVLRTDTYVVNNKPSRPSIAHP